MTKCQDFDENGLRCLNYPTKFYKFYRSPIVKTLVRCDHHIPSFGLISALDAQEITEDEYVAIQVSND